MPFKPRILVTNDDGISSHGIKALIEVAAQYGEVTVIAPDKPMSGVGHSITMRNPITVEQVFQYNGIPSWKCSGTPVDCVKFALSRIMRGKPDLIVSGINHGSNASINALYSGTVAAALEGCIEGISSLAFSLTAWEENADLTVSKKVAAHIIKKTLETELPRGVMLNVNVPEVNGNQFKGIRLCKQAKVYWHEKFIDDVDTNGNKVFWLTGDFFHDDDQEDTDQWALENNFASVVPIQIDLTAHKMIPLLKNFEHDEKI